LPVLYIVAYLLKARTVEPEKQALLAKGSQTTFLSRQLLGKYVSAARISMQQKNGVFCVAVREML
jgi:hypothetical protein